MKETYIQRERLYAFAQAHNTEVVITPNQDRAEILIRLEEKGRMKLHFTPVHLVVETGEVLPPVGPLEITHFRFNIFNTAPYVLTKKGQHKSVMAQRDRILRTLQIWAGPII